MVTIRDSIFIAITFIVAILLSIFPLSDFFQWIRPQWVILVLIYWVVASNRGVGLIMSWCVGIVVDLINGGIIGEYAFLMLLISCIASSISNRIKLYSFGQQAFIILVLFSASHILLYWIQWALGHPPSSSLYWGSILLNVLLWPLAYRVLRQYERKVLG